MLSAANDAASSINMAEMEANIQANLQAQINAGASKADLLAGAGSEDLSMPANSAFAMSSMQSGSMPAANSVINKVLASHNIQTKQVVSTPVSQPSFVTT